MNRRIALRHLALISGGLALIPSCDFSSDDILAAYKNLKVSASQKHLLGEISDTIIPAGELKGALELEVPDFILVMVNDCMNTENQALFSTGLAAFPDFAKNTVGKKFDQLSTREKEDLIQAGIDLKPEENPEGENDKAVSYFLNTTKRLTMQGYMASEYIQTEIIPYSLIPSPYNGSALISESQKPRING
ncbi:gluconate 2-dehydrogenase subunit 3 family protein [Algoriphagus sp. D3-2-R+10]|uniref:gluconate 2-dehydrogenase subunit 3 family protein n=1 Tax=Algoriphagus aurantiacus TaxID=3103948 RepID=UPI002B3FE373|nr:gluconate 2-dehydrogenase subunit 3 family protein [Algoriphagus sp. D3-2-R+10]MEB2774753.1 gluconate 2-dehydrogenase subunit 3 family protein [Algoriphagus sp. D3-2-R+10]